MTLRPLAAGLIGLTLAGCAVGPDYERPADPTQPGFDLATLPAAERAAIPGPHLTEGPVPADWWTLLKSPALDATEAQALADNATVAAAKATLRQAQQQVIEAEAAWWPQVSLSAGVSRNGSGGFTPSGGGFSSNYFSIGPAFSYTADLFGATARAVEQSVAQEDYQRIEVEAARLTLVGGVATDAIAIASARLQLATAEEILASDQQNLSMVQKQFAVGKAARSDVLTAQSQLASDQALFPPLYQQLAAARHALAVLLGDPPAQWSQPDVELTDLRLPAQLPVSVPSQLVRSRPDILAAEAQLHAATAAVGVATANLYPQIALTATLGQQALTPSKLFDASSTAWSLIGGLTQPLFEGGTLRAEQRAALDALHASAARYQQVVLDSFGQVADLLDALDHDAQLVAAEANARDTSQASLELARQSYQAGNTGVLQVLDAQRERQRAELGFLQAQSHQYLDTIQLLLAVGGGPLT